MKQVTIENVKARIAALETSEHIGGSLSMVSEFELACLRQLLATMGSEPVAFLTERKPGFKGYGPARRIVDAKQYNPLSEDYWSAGARENHSVTPLYLHAQPAQESNPSRICAESYQVVAALAEALGIFNEIGVIKALDNLSAQKLIHDDVLPFSVPEEIQPAPSEPPC